MYHILAFGGQPCPQNVDFSVKQANFSVDFKTFFSQNRFTRKFLLLC